MKGNQSMPSIAYIVQPQRRGDAGWQQCPPHAAQRWAVMREQRGKNRRNGALRSYKLITTYTNRTLADEHALRLTRHVNASGLASPIFSRVLGGRFGPLRGEPIARSLTLEQWQAKKGR